MTQVSEEMLNVFSTALEMEEKGRLFYEEAVGKCETELGRQLFDTLRADELVHVERIRAIYDSLTGGAGWSEEWKSMQVEQRDLGEVFRELAIKHGRRIHAGTTELEALDVGLDFEMKSVKFYEARWETAVDELEKEFIAQMIEEERMHHTVLADMNFYLTDPESWFRENERGGLDGA